MAADSTVLRAPGGVWHKKHREAGEVPHTAIDTQAHWAKSGWHGWVYGWKLPLLTVVADVWIPLAADLTPANADDRTTTAKLRWWNHAELAPDVRYLLGDQPYNTPLSSEAERRTRQPRQSRSKQGFQHQPDKKQHNSAKITL